ncbi:MAG: alpha/beta fold hydrolase [Acidobacteria bacterium]|nr:alpha/beta fold hydrolase [Acidobacteriota bacterium]
MTRILYFHGFASGPSSSKARFLAADLRDRGARVDVPDLAAGDFSHLTLTSQLAVIEQAARGEPVSLIGSSMGGYLAALYAARHPEVPRVVLLAPAFGFARRWPQRLGAGTVAEWRRTGWMPIFHYGENREVPLSVALLEDGARYEDYPAFAQPALIFHGSQDDVVPASFSAEFAAAHPNARLEVLDSGHELTDVLDYMAPRIAAFLLDPA